jgi:RHS repeat-associated protein
MIAGQLRFARAMSAALLVMFVSLFAVEAQAQLPAYPPPAVNTGERWCATAPLGYTGPRCFADATSACYVSWREFNGSPESTFFGAQDSGDPSRKNCAWSYYNNYCLVNGVVQGTVNGVQSGSINACGGVVFYGVADLQCNDPTTPSTQLRVGRDGKCVPLKAVFHDPGPCSTSPIPGNNGEKSDNPILYANGAKVLFANDYTGADPRFSLSRSYRSFITGPGPNKGDPLGFSAKWRGNLMPELHLRVASNGSFQAWARLPDGSSYLLQRDGATGLFAPADYPIASYRMAVAFPGTWPATNGAALASVQTFTMTDDNDAVWTMVSELTSSGYYDVARPTQVVFRDGYTMTYAYVTVAGAGQKQLSTVTDSFGRVMTFTWSYVDNTLFSGSTRTNVPKTPAAITQVALPDGTTLVYTYESLVAAYTAPRADRLKTVKRISGATVLDQTTYLYENASFPKHITGMIDNRGVRTGTFVYDAEGRAISSELANGADKVTVAYSEDVSGTTLLSVNRTVTNALGKQTVYKYGVVAHVDLFDVFDAYTMSAGAVRLTSVDGIASTNCPASNVPLTYDAAYNPATTTDAEGRVTAYVRDSKGRPTSITEGSGKPEATTRTITYHPTLNVPATIIEPGLTTTYTYTTGRLTSMTLTDTSTAAPARTTTYTYGTGGNLLTVDGPLAGTGDKTTYTYTAAGYLASVSRQVSAVLTANLVTTINTVNTRGQPTQITDPNGVITTMTYDGMGRLLTTNVNPGATVATTTMTYDAIGQVTRVTRPDNSYFDYVYDGAKRVTSVTSNLGEKIEYVYDLMSNVSSRTVKGATGTIVRSQTAAFDELGRTLRSIGASNQTTTYSYDKTSNLKSTTDPRGKLFSYGYDSVNRLIQELDPNGSAVNYTKDTRSLTTAYADPRNLQTTYVYNGFREMIRQASPDSGVTDYVRDNRGLVTKITDGRNVVTDMTYDNIGRMLTKTYPAATAENVSYVYDTFVAGTNFGKGRVSKITSQSVVIDLTYDQRGNVLTEKRTIGGQAYTVAYVYDKADRVTQITYPSGRVVSYVRAVDGRISGVTTKQNAAAAVVNLASSIVYQPLSGVVQSMVYSNGLNDFNSFTPDGEIDVLGTYNGAASVINRSHTRTDNQNLTNIFDNVTTANTSSFWMEPAGKLQNADGPWGSKTFYYDGVGNRVTELSTPLGGTATNDTYGYPAGSNRLVQITRGAATMAAMTYDAAGNLLTDNRLGLNKTYTYNKRNRMATATVGANAYAYTYSGREQLAIRQKTAGVAPLATTHFVHDIFGNVLAETSGVAAGTFREYIWLPETEIAPTREAMSQVDRPLAVVNGVGTTGIAVWNVSVDHLNRPVLMTNATKVAMWTAVWQPWGGQHSFTGTATLDTRFPGQWYQAETGLHYNWHRQYDPTVGRYTQVDPLGFVDGPSVYGYAGGKPQQLVDKDGRQAITIPGTPIVIPAPPQIAVPVLVIAVAIAYCTTECTPPVGTKCYEDAHNDDHGGLNPHYHIHEMQRHAGTLFKCEWRYLGGKVGKGVLASPAPSMRACSSYPNFSPRPPSRPHHK